MLGKNEKTIKIKNFNIHVEELAPHETPEYIAQRIQQATIEILDKLEAKKQLDAYLNSNEERGTNNSPQQVSVTNKKKENPKRETSKPGASVLINTAKISSSFKETPSIKKETSKSNKDFGVTKKANKITNDTGFGFANKKQITISSNEELVNAYQALNGVSNNNEVLVKTIKERYLNEKAVTYDARKVKYWKETIKKIEEGTPVVALIKQPEHKELKKVYDEIIVNAKEGEKLTKKKLRNFIINEIEEKYIANKKTTSKKLSYWTAILGQLKNANFSLESILSNNEELFLFLDLLTDVDFDVLPKDLLKINASVYPSFRNLYPKNLSSSKIYAVLNKLTDKTGRSVSKVTKDKKGIKHLKDTSIKFAANIKNPNINWKIYKKDGSLLHTFVDIGEEFSFTFAEYGEFVVEAYGNKAEYKKGKYAKAKKNNKSYIAIHIKKPALTSILVKENATKNLMIRLEESLTFVATADVGENSSIPLITWYMCYKSAKKEKYTEEEITNAKGVTEFKQLFNKKGIYTIKAVSESITKEVTFKVGNNYPNAISVDKSWVLYNTQQSFNCKVIAYRMNPVTAEEINQTKWVVFKDEKIYIPKGLQKIDNKPYVATGNCFNFVPHEAGNYVVESYMNYSSYNSSKKLTNACKSIKVVQPQVTKANWADSSGLLKLQTGYQKQVKNYINASIPNYNNKPIIVGVYEDVGYKKLIGSYNTQTDKNGDVNLQLCLGDDTAITKFIATSKATTVAIYFNIQAKGYTLKKSIANSKLSKIIVSKEPKIIRSYFMYDGNIISSHLQAVPYGTKITFIAETTNIIGQKIKLELYRTEAADNYNGKQITENNNVVVNAEGKVVVPFTLSEKWMAKNNKAPYFYVGVEKEDGSWWSTEKDSLMLRAHQQGEIIDKSIKILNNDPIQKWLELEYDKSSTAKKNASIADIILKGESLGLVKFNSEGKDNFDSGFGGTKDTFIKIRDGKQIGNGKGTAKPKKYFDPKIENIPVLESVLQIIKSNVINWKDNNFSPKKPNRLALGSFMVWNSSGSLRRSKHGNKASAIDFNLRTSENKKIAFNQPDAEKMILEVIKNLPKGNYGIGLPGQGGFFPSESKWKSLGLSKHTSQLNGKSNKAYTKIINNNLKVELEKRVKNSKTIIFPDNENHLHIQLQ